MQDAWPSFFDNGDDSSSDDSDNDSDGGWACRALEEFRERELRQPVTAVGCPQSQSQSSFLANLWKLLLDANSLNSVEDWIHWTVANVGGNNRVGYVVNWTVALQRWDDDVLDTLVRYRLFRRTNRSGCALASWARKAREWSFTICPLDGEENNAVFYFTDYPALAAYDFRPTVHYSTFPVARCRRLLAAGGGVVTRMSVEC